METTYVAGADIGGSHITCCVVDIAKGVVVRHSEVFCELDCNWSATKIIDVWSTTIAKSIKASGKPTSDIGIAIPGPFDYRHGIATIEGVQKYEHIFGLDVTSSLRAILGHKVNFLYTNDAAAFALGESLCGAAKDVDRAVILTLGTGLGSGFVAGGRLVESGVDVPPNGWVYNLPYNGAMADDEFTTRWFVRRYQELTGECVAGARQIAELVVTQSEARQVFEEYGRRLAEFALPLCINFRSHTLVVGGSISRAINIFGPAFMQHINRLGGKIDLHQAKLQETAAMIGAATLHKNINL